MDNKVYSLPQLEQVLLNVGNALEKKCHIIAVGGFCMLLLRSRVFTTDIDFIPRDSEFVVPLEYADILNHDILNLSTLLLDFETIRKFTETQKQYGNLTVHLASSELLLAMKLIARQARHQERDLLDIKHLYAISDWQKMYEIYTIINRGAMETAQDLQAFIETELWLLEQGGM